MSQFKNIMYILIFLTTSVHGQDDLIHFDNCHSEVFCVDCDDVRAEMQDGTSLTDYFLEKIEKKKIEELTGKIYLYVLIDTIGRSCCRTIGNKSNVSNEEIVNLHLDKIISDMGLWKPKNSNKAKESNLIILEIKFDKQTLTVEHPTVKVLTNSPWEK